MLQMLKTQIRDIFEKKKRFQENNKSLCIQYKEINSLNKLVLHVKQVGTFFVPNALKGTFCKWVKWCRQGSK